MLTDAAGNTASIKQIAASGPISSIPEFHDCQRLVVDSARTQFGPLVALFASLKLEPLNAPPPLSGPQQPAVAVPPGATPPPAPLSEWAAVTILNYDTTWYAPLHIEGGISCLYLFDIEGVWHAKLVRASLGTTALASDDAACVQQLVSQPGFELAVRTVSPPVGALVPPVAKWDWDSIRGEHFIGVKCSATANLWCEVYNPAPTGAAATSSPTYSGQQTFSVKGWYDEQYLAVKVTGGPLTPGTVKATIFPMPDLDTRDTSYYAAWQPVALVALSDVSPEYAAKFNFKNGPAPAGQTTIHLCKGSMTSCEVPAGAVNTCSQPIVDGVKDEWWAKIVSDTVA